jgi:hypothetical protein
MNKPLPEGISMTQHSHQTAPTHSSSKLTASALPIAALAGERQGFARPD